MIDKKYQYNWLQNWLYYKITSSWIITKEENQVKIINIWNNSNISISLKSWISWIQNKYLNFIQDKLKNKEVSIRMYLIRHWITEKEENLIEKNVLQYSNDELSNNAIININKILIPKLKILWINKNNSYIFYSKWQDFFNPVLRITQTADIIIKNLWINSFRIDSNVYWLDTTDKTNLNVYNRDTKTWSLSSDFALELESKIKNLKLKNINLICIIHKTNYSCIENTLLEKNPNIIIMDYSNIKHLEIKHIDFDNNWNPINYKNENLLNLNDINYKEILFILYKNKIFSKFINDFKNQKIQIWELQNYINACFVNKKDLFKEYLLSNQNDLKIFCLKNLIDQNEFNAITKYYFKIKKDKKISEYEKEILIWNISNFNEIKNIIIHLFVIKNKFTEDNFSLFEKNNLKNFYIDLKIKKAIFDKIKELELRSLDNEIKEWHWYVQREILKIDKINNNFEYKSFSTTEIIESLINNKQKIILTSSVWSGKSIWLLNLAKKIILTYDINIYFFEWKHFLEEDDLKKLDQENAIIFIDSLDEIKNENLKIQIKNKLLQINNSILITSRLSEYKENYNSWFNQIIFKEINFKNFIKLKIKNKMKRKDIFNFIEKSHLSQDNDISWNPLLLNFVCIIANNENKYSNLWIENLNEIINKAQLYENISKFVLEIYEKNKFIKIYNKNQVEKNLKRLSFFAYWLFCGKKTHEIIEENYDLLWEEDLDNINLLTKNQKKEYNFIHNSFYEYFLARYFAYKIWWEIEMYEYKQNMAIKNIFNFQNYRSERSVLLFYYEILENLSKYDILINFLKEEFSSLSQEDILLASKRILELNWLLK